jgi:hypothetical protein
MNEHLNQNCERMEALIAAWFEPDGLSSGERDQVNSHMASCAVCRESFELASRMEAALVSRRSDVPAVGSFLPAFVSAPVVAVAHPRLLAVFRTLMSPAGISVMLVSWGAMLALHFRHQIGEVFAWTSEDRFAALARDISNLLLSVSRGDAYTLTGIYILLAIAILGSTGAITLRYIRNS